MRILWTLCLSVITLPPHVDSGAPGPGAVEHGLPAVPAEVLVAERAVHVVAAAVLLDRDHAERARTEVLKGNKFR